jgi:hypothetical protein
MMAWRTMEWGAVARGMRPCALTMIGVDDRTAFEQTCTAAGLRTSLLTDAGRTCEMLVAHDGNVGAFEQAWSVGDHDRIGALLGYPPCCRAAFGRWRAEGYEVDPTWALYAGGQDRGELCTVEPLAMTTNVLLRWLHVVSIPHLPCTPNCVASADQAARWEQLGEELGFSDERQWTRDILSFPMEWSALHGIAEVKLPVLKFITRTDATATRFVVQWKGTVVPDEAQRGVRFPFRPNPRQPLTHSASFMRGSAHIAEVGPTRS